MPRLPANRGLKEDPANPVLGGECDEAEVVVSMILCCSYRRRRLCSPMCLGDDEDARIRGYSLLCVEEGDGEEERGAGASRSEEGALSLVEKGVAPTCLLCHRPASCAGDALLRATSGWRVGSRHRRHKARRQGSAPSPSSCSVLGAVNGGVVGRGWGRRRGIGHGGTAAAVGGRSAWGAAVQGRTGCVGGCRRRSVWCPGDASLRRCGYEVERRELGE